MQCILSGHSLCSLCSFVLTPSHCSLRIHRPHSKSRWCAKSQDPRYPMKGGSLCFQSQKSCYYFDEEEEGRENFLKNLLHSFIHCFIYNSERYIIIPILEMREQNLRKIKRQLLECNCSWLPSLAVSRSALSKSLQLQGTLSDCPPWFYADFNGFGGNEGMLSVSVSSSLCLCLFLRESQGVRSHREHTEFRELRLLQVLLVVCSCLLEASWSLSCQEFFCLYTHPTPPLPPTPQPQ